MSPPAEPSLPIPLRIAAACGAVGVPGEVLLAMAAAVGDLATGLPLVGSDARLDRLTVLFRVGAGAVARALHAARVDPDPALGLVERLRPAEVLLRVTTTAGGTTTAGVEVAVDLPVGEALARLGSAGASALGDAVAALGLPRATALGVSGEALTLTLGQALTAAALPARMAAVEAAARLVASEPQARWAGAMLGALAPGRDEAPITLTAGPPGLSEVALRFDAVAVETVLRAVLAVHPADRTPAVLGALAAAAEAPDLATLELGAHRAEPPRIEFAFGHV